MPPRCSDYCVFLFWDGDGGRNLCEQNRVLDCLCQARDNTLDAGLLKGCWPKSAGRRQPSVSKSMAPEDCRRGTTARRIVVLLRRSVDEEVAVGVGATPVACPEIFE